MTSEFATAKRTVAVLAGVLVLVAGGTISTAAIVSPAAPLPASADTWRFHPGLGFGSAEFNYTFGGPIPGFSLQASRTGTFDQGLKGVLRSAAYVADSDGHALFLYQVELDPQSDMLMNGNVDGYESWDVMDCGIARSGGPSLLSGDPDALWRLAVAPSQINFSFMDYGGFGILAGETSAWMYAETEALKSALGNAALMGANGSGLGNVEALVPVPEPGALAVLSVGAVWVVTWRKKRHAASAQRARSTTDR